MNCLLKARAIAFGLEWIFPSKVTDARWVIRPLATQFAQKRPVALGIGSTVREFLQRSPLVLHFLADVPLDVLVQQLDGRVERVVNAALVSVVVANAPAGGVGRGKVREGEGGTQEGERKKGQRGGSVPPPSVVPTCRPLGLAGQLKTCGTE